MGPLVALREYDIFNVYFTYPAYPAEASLGRRLVLYSEQRNANSSNFHCHVISSDPLRVWENTTSTSAIDPENCRAFSQASMFGSCALILGLEFPMGGILPALDLAAK